MERYDGALPADAEALRGIPGIGRYTAGAIASTAFGLREPVLDGNVRRVLSRLFAVDETVAGAGAAERELWSIAGALADGPSPGDLNQALMELGATVCRPSAPDCRTCPVAARCAALGEGRPTRYPAARRRPATERVAVAVAVVTRGKRVLLERPAAENPFRGRWDLPALELADGADGAVRLRRSLAERHGVEAVIGPSIAAACHGIMHRRLELAVHRGRLLRGRVADRETLRWVAPDEISETAVSGATRKVLRASDAVAPGKRRRASTATPCG
jgi:A/G-specific adenine glycosylase